MNNISDREHDFKVQVNTFSLTYPKPMLEEFFNYWTEPNKSGTRMKWELEKTWHLGRRLARWANNDFGKGKVEVKKQVTEPPKNPTEIDLLDSDLQTYRHRPTAFPFENFGKWYEVLRNLKLIRPMAKKDVENLKQIYNNDNFKCRCAVVQMTFDWYGINGFLFSDSLKVRTV